MRNKLKALVYAWLVAMVCLSAAEGSMLLCLHFTTENQATDSASGAAACESHCDVVVEHGCVDIKIDGLDLDFGRDQAEISAPELVLIGQVIVLDLPTWHSSESISCFPTRAPPGLTPHIHESVRTTVLRI